MFVDVTKAFDTHKLGKIMSKLDCPEKFISIVCQRHDGKFAQVVDSGQCSCASPVINGVKQGCVLAPMLISMMFSAMLSDTFSEDKHSLKGNYRTDGKFVHLKRLQSYDQSGGSVGARFSVCR